MSIRAATNRGFQKDTKQDPNSFVMRFETLVDDKARMGNVYIPKITFLEAKKSVPCVVVCSREVTGQPGKKYYDVFVLRSVAMSGILDYDDSLCTLTRGGGGGVAVVWRWHGGVIAVAWQRRSGVVAVGWQWQWKWSWLLGELSVFTHCSEWLVALMAFSIFISTVVVMKKP